MINHTQKLINGTSRYGSGQSKIASSSSNWTWTLLFIGSLYPAIFKNYLKIKNNYYLKIKKIMYKKRVMEN